MVFVFLIAVLIVVFFMAFPREQITSYGGSKTSTHVFLLGASQEEKLKNGGVSSENWSISFDSAEAGATLDKDVVIENQATDSYFRVIVKVADKNGDTSEGKAVGKEMSPNDDEATKSRLRKILSTIYYDKGSNLREGTSYTKAELLEMQQYSRISSVYNPYDFEPETSNSDIALNGWNEQLKAYVFLYRSDNANKFFRSSSTRFCTNVLIPTDATKAEIDEMGNFSINVSVQAIAMDGFSGRAEALSSFNGTSTSSSSTSTSTSSNTSNTGYSQ